jgi:hypothetical protein
MNTKPTDVEKEYLIGIIIEITNWSQTHTDRQLRKMCANYSTGIIRNSIIYELGVHKDDSACKKYLWMLPLL